MEQAEAGDQEEDTHELVAVALAVVEVEVEADSVTDDHQLRVTDAWMRPVPKACLSLLSETLSASSLSVVSRKSART